MQNSIVKLQEHEISSHSRISDRGRVRNERKLDEEKEEEIGVYAISQGKNVHVSTSYKILFSQARPVKSVP